MSPAAAKCPLFHTPCYRLRCVALCVELYWWPLVVRISGGGLCWWLSGVGKWAKRLTLCMRGAEGFWVWVVLGRGGVLGLLICTLTPWGC
jgi:hypothetical protein